MHIERLTKASRPFMDLVGIPSRNKVLTDLGVGLLAHPHNGIGITHRVASQ